MFGRILEKNQKSTIIFQNGQLITLNFQSKHKIGDIIDYKDTLLCTCENTKPLKNLPEIYSYYTKKFEYIEKIKIFLKNKGFLEVITPKLKKNILKEPNINYIKTPYGFLSASPEIEIKKLLSLGFNKLFELSYVYRNDEPDNLHKREFLILEWYETLKSPKQVIAQSIELIKYLIQSDMLAYKNMIINLDRIEFLSYEEVFKLFTNIDIRTANINSLAKKFSIYGVSDPSGILDAIFSLKIEKKLGLKNPLIVYDFPEERASLSKTEDGYAKRYETYIAGIEISNCYMEENNVSKIKNRFKEVEHEFIEAMAFGIPPTSGIAVGIDRLLMILLNQSKI